MPLRSDMPPSASIDRLSGLLMRFPVSAHLHHNGPLCGLNHFDAALGHGFLHVLRRGHLKVTHPGAREVPTQLLVTEPTLLLYARPFTHRFHNPPAEGSDFTCAQLHFDGGAQHPLAMALPPLVLAPLAQVPGLEASLQLLLAETAHVRCGQRLLADRLFEVVLLQLLRWLLDHPATPGLPAGLLPGLAHPALARALTAMHEHPGQAWHLPLLAELAGMSRTRFATEFHAVVGQPPADYLADWRMRLAQQGLRAGRSVKELADALGYANASALSRAFNARLGCSPRAWVSTLTRS
ncbi:helix-turn-helix transcriptional regulator [Aquabacterium lacunae]|nr:AraC family transcriptional regulator [Aquabacterium lacunae]